MQAQGKTHRTNNKKHKISRKDFVTMKEFDLIANEESSIASQNLKGIRHRENLTQVQFSKLINVTQANLSMMENDKRPIGKNMAKRIAEIFKIDYRLLL